MGLFPASVKPVLAGLPFGAYGNVYFVDATNGNDSNPGTSWEQPLATILAAYNKCTANQNDIVAVIGAGGSQTLSAALVWAKDYTHLVGLCAPTRVAKRSRIFQLSTLTGASPLLSITASGCIFKDFYIFQGVADATSLLNVQVSGGRNYFENVHFAGGGHATQAVNGGASLNLEGCEENTFVNCVLGIDTISAATGMRCLALDGEAHRNIFEDCLFTLYAGHAGAMFVEAEDSTGFDRYTIFKRCLFINTSATAMTTAFEIPAGVGAPRTIYLMDSYLHGATDWEDNDRGVVFLSGGTITAGGNAGIMQATVKA